MVVVVVVLLGRSVSKMAARALMRRADVDRWWMTAMEIAKSNEERGCGKESVSAMMDVCGVWRDEIFTRFSEL